MRDTIEGAQEGIEKTKKSIATQKRREKKRKERFYLLLIVVIIYIRKKLKNGNSRKVKFLKSLIFVKIQLLNFGQLNQVQKVKKLASY